MTTTTKKATTRKPAAKTTAAPGKTAARRKAVPPEDRLEMISVAAYLRAESRGFAGGDPVADWHAAEAEVEARLGG